MKVLLKELLQVFKFNLASTANFVLLSLCLSTQAADKLAINLSGEVKQGGLMVGKTAANNTVMLNDQPLKVSVTGDYAFGFSRDDNNTYQLVITDSQGNKVEKTLKPAPQKYNIQRVNGIKKAIMNPNVKAQTRSKKDSAQIKAIREISSDLNAFAQGFIPPIDGVITGVYGSQRFYNGVPKSPHYGLDYAGKIGDPVKAPANGVILLWVPDMFYSGGTMVIDHGHGISSTFLHLSKSYVQVGDEVKQGQVVAAVGNSGRTTGPHLDWRINWHQMRLDPALALKINQ